MTPGELIALGGLGGGAVGWVLNALLKGGKKLILDRIDALSEKVDELKETVSEMKTQNAHDHGEVKSEIAALKARVDGMQSPWRRDQPSTH